MLVSGREKITSVFFIAHLSHQATKKNQLSTPWALKMTVEWKGDTCCANAWKGTKNTLGLWPLWPKKSPDTWLVEAPNSATKKTLITFRYTGWFIGILIMVYYNWVVKSPIQPKQPDFCYCSTRYSKVDHLLMFQGEEACCWLKKQGHTRTHTHTQKMWIWTPVDCWVIKTVFCYSTEHRLPSHFKIFGPEKSNVARIIQEEFPDFQQEIHGNSLFSMQWWCFFWNPYVFLDFFCVKFPKKRHILNLFAICGGLQQLLSLLRKTPQASWTWLPKPNTRDPLVEAGIYSSCGSHGTIV